MSQNRQERAKTVLASIRRGAVPVDLFTTQGRWWWNGGLDRKRRGNRALTPGLA